MNEVKSVLETHKEKRVWFYLRDEEAKVRFKEELVSLNAAWVDGSRFEQEHHVSSFMAVHPDRQVAFVSFLCWKIGSTPDYRDVITRIDYKKLIQHEDCLMTE